MISVAEEMGIVLRRSSFSANIKERKDFSCALFDANGRLVAQAEHIPVHLGAMPYSVKTVIEEFAHDLASGDCIILNDPFKGGTHLPDITVVNPVFYREELFGFTANRAHHSDVGGEVPGSMSPLSTNIDQEGLRIAPTKLVQKGELNRKFLDFILSKVRTPKERLGDLNAQQAANALGAKRFAELLGKFGIETVSSGMRQLIMYSDKLMLGEIRSLPEKSASSIDYLDDDGFEARDIPIRVKVSVKPNRITFDFTGTANQVKGPLNAVYSITQSAVYYVVRCITDPTIPANAGCFERLEIHAPQGTIVNAQPPAAVAGGNVETSQRIVDVVLRAFSQLVPDRVCAACQGTMNNITIGGVNLGTGQYFTYYETVAGGFGARYDKNGVDGIHSHMTNTMNTPIEALEPSYPVRVTCYELVPGSGGRGMFVGGLGIRREIELLTEDASVSLLGERQRRGPWGLKGGLGGRPGEYYLLRNGERHRLSSKCVIRTKHGDIIGLRTPGGGGYGRPGSSASSI